jgi:class 3 adenylate cyclase
LAAERVERKLAAILAADVAGYSRLTGADEEGTLARLKAHRRELIDPKIAEHRGRIVKTTGDGLLVEFASPVEAVRCAGEIQKAMREREGSLPDDQRIEIRIGINLGDVIIDEDDVYGDGVNIAARLEALADPGGVVVSSAVFEQVRDRVPDSFEDLGDQQVKNIARPVRVYRMRDLGAAPKSSSAPASPPLPLSDKPSIAVLPFQNMTGDPEHASRFNRRGREFRQPFPGANGPRRNCCALTGAEGLNPSPSSGESANSRSLCSTDLKAMCEASVSRLSVPTSPSATQKRVERCSLGRSLASPRTARHIVGRALDIRLESKLSDCDDHSPVPGAACRDI